MQKTTCQTRNASRHSRAAAVGVVGFLCGPLTTGWLPAVGAAVNKGADKQIRQATAQIVDAGGAEPGVTLVGRLAYLRCTVTPVVEGATYQWSVGGDVVKSYLMDVEKAEMVPLGDDDLHSADVRFYWWRWSLANRVDCLVRLPDGKAFKPTATVKVISPHADGATLEFTNAVPKIAIGNSGYQDMDPCLALGAWSDPGLRVKTVEIDTRACASVDGQGAGQVGLLQLITPCRKFRRDDGSRFGLISSMPVLDDPPSGGLWAVPPSAVPGNAKLERTDPAGYLYYDTPRSTCRQMSRVLVDDTYAAFVMYRPEGDDSIWVPLSRRGWEWEGAGTKPAGGAWPVVRTNAQGAYCKIKSSTAFPRPPTWDMRLMTLPIQEGIPDF